MLGALRVKILNQVLIKSYKASLMLYGVSQGRTLR
jgi:hypothetical protein